MKEYIAKLVNFIFKGNIFQAPRIAYNISRVKPFPGYCLQLAPVSQCGRHSPPGTSAQEIVGF